MRTMRQQPITLWVAAVVQILFEIFALGASLVLLRSNVPIQGARLLGVIALAYFALKGRRWARIVLLRLVYATALADVVILIAFPETDHRAKTAIRLMLSVEILVGILGTIPGGKRTPDPSPEKESPGRHGAETG